MSTPPEWFTLKSRPVRKDFEYDPYGPPVRSDYSASLAYWRARPPFFARSVTGQCLCIPFRVHDRVLVGIIRVLGTSGTGGLKGPFGARFSRAPWGVGGGTPATHCLRREKQMNRTSLSARELDVHAAVRHTASRDREKPNSSVFVDHARTLGSRVPQHTWRNRCRGTWNSFSASQPWNRHCRGLAGRAGQAHTHTRSTHTWRPRNGVGFPPGNPAREAGGPAVELLRRP
ncbi:hypothetical protein BDY21DRAFT_55116 [Lineolata rhizophorae]|uniref:Uncharacterized protein n=1 Tax=Lineolata rhizophorae TaxID=578093 RepID=A0A6A6NWW0_9PEZI|nr:hypothetical protein BDY21DRAFT_55116 [Lineolata rhizophorae]